ncbi:MAG: type-F conjugative transfer system secretin TraK [Rhodospirillales bacterium]|nr:type-F conjugative transfer system secretin TraK [Rhodospirillales bacterium]
MTWTIPRQRALAALVAAQLTVMGALAASAPAAAMQVLDAADHGEIAAEISATGVNRIALAGDRITKVVRSPDGFAVEHDAASGDLYIRPAGGATGTPGAGTAGFEPVTLFIGTEAGFTYRLTLTPAPRDSAQILIRNGDIAPAAGSVVPASGGDPHVAVLVRLVRAVARREPLPGTEILAGGSSPVPGIQLVETWRGPRFTALVLETGLSAEGFSADLSADLSAKDLPGDHSSADLSAAGSSADHSATDLARSLGRLPGLGPLAALWLAPPGTGPSGGRLAVAVVENVGPESRP